MKRGFGLLDLVWRNGEDREAAGLGRVRIQTKSCALARQLEPRQVEFCLARHEVAGVLLAETNIPVAVDGVVEQACKAQDARSKFCH